MSGENPLNGDLTILENYSYLSFDIFPREEFCSSFLFEVKSWILIVVHQPVKLVTRFTGMTNRILSLKKCKIVPDTVKSCTCY